MLASEYCQEAQKEIPSLPVQEEDFTEWGPSYNVNTDKALKSEHKSEWGHHYQKILEQDLTLGFLHILKTKG